MKLGVCIHYSGILNNACRIGINYIELARGEDVGWVRRLPCLERHASAITCSRREFPTAEQVAAWEQEWSEATEMVVKARKLVPDVGPGGTVTCPRCGGTLHWVRSARNGHVHGQCETLNCVRWMQ